MSWPFQPTPLEHTWRTRLVEIMRLAHDNDEISCLIKTIAARCQDYRDMARESLASEFGHDQSSGFQNNPLQI
jgi:hypothetical protein